MNPERVEVMAALWSEIETEEYRLKQKKKEFFEQLTDELEKEGLVKRSGTVSVDGATRKLSVTFRENVKYPDKKALEEWFLSHKEGEELFRVSLNERRAKVEKYLKTESEGAVLLSSMRVKSPGSPKVEVKRLPKD